MNVKSKKDVCSPATPHRHHLHINHHLLCEIKHSYQARRLFLVSHENAFFVLVKKLVLFIKKIIPLKIVV